MKYDLKVAHTKEGADQYLVHFATMLNKQNYAACLLQEPSEVHALTDPVSMQVVPLKIVTHHQVIVPGSWYAAPVTGKRYMEVDYTPNVLGSERSGSHLLSLCRRRAMVGASTEQPGHSWLIITTAIGYKSPLGSMLHQSKEES